MGMISPGFSFFFPLAIKDYSESQTGGSQQLYIGEITLGFLLSGTNVHIEEIFDSHYFTHGYGEIMIKLLLQYQFTDQGTSCAPL